jgi:hypothetical protein
MIRGQRLAVTFSARNSSSITIEIECNDCNGLFEYGTWGSNEYKDLYKLGELFKTSLIGDDICCTIDEKGETIYSSSGRFNL